MRTEIIKKHTKEVCVNITAGVADSLRLQSEKLSTVRVYDGGFIGIAGKKGAASTEALTEEAKNNLSRGIPYPDKPEASLTLDVNAYKHIIDDKDFLPYVSAAAKRIAEENPGFIINGKAYLNETETVYDNGAGRKLSYKGNATSMAVIYKDKKSANIMDGSIAVEDNKIIGEDFFKDVKTRLDAFLTPVDHFKEDKIPVIMSGSYFSFALQHFVADIYCNGASLFNGKLGEKIFNENFSVIFDHDPERRLAERFFDAEGVVNEGYKSYLVKNGVMRNLLTTKSTAERYGVENIGNADASYAGAPSVSANGFDVERGNKSLNELLNGREAIFLDVSSGGDMTPDGNIGLPVQLAFLYRDGKIVGRLPEFSLTGNIFDVFGKDFIGTCSVEDVFKSLKRDTVIVTEMNVVNKK